MLKRLLRKLFLRKEIKSKEGVLHFQRWGVWTPWLGIYFHYIAKADKDKHPHSHPWNFFTFILSGGYIENFWSAELDQNGKCKQTITTARPGRGFFRSRDGFHQLIELLGPTWTFVVTGKDYDLWGYLVEENDEYLYWDFESYREEKRKGRWK